jgi:TetR/AcrR family transcriptional regulator
VKPRDLHNPPKERIYRSAKKEFSERGYSGARMSGIARRASVNKALIHYYFKDKENLYLEVLRRIFAGTKSDSSIPDYLGTRDLAPSQKLYICIYFIVNIFLKATDPDALKIIFWEVSEGGKNLDSLMMEYTVPWHKVLVGVVREGVEKKEFETPDPLLTVMSIISFMSNYVINKEIYHGKSVFLELYGRAGEQEVFEFVLELVFKSLKPKDRKLDVPEIPEDLKLLTEQLLKILVEKKDEGANEEVFKRVENILKH